MTNKNTQLPPKVGHILCLAEIIREVDGNHDKGAAALAEAILNHPGSRWVPANKSIQWKHKKIAQMANIRQQRPKYILQWTHGALIGAFLMANSKTGTSLSANGNHVS